MRGQFLPFSPPAIGEQEISEVVDTLRSNWITTGPKVKQFESKFAEFVGAHGALGVSSCTDALQVALAALGVGPGDVVLTTTLTFCATAHVVEHLGARPFLVDVDRDTLNISPQALIAAIDQVKKKNLGTLRAVIPVHFAGHPVDMAEILEIAREHSLAILEDAAHALPASWGNEMVGSVPESGIQRAAAFSFYATKNMTTGEGGMLTATPDWLEEARLWAQHGMNRDAWRRYGKGGSWHYDVVRPGFKCNMTDIEAALGVVQLNRLNEFQNTRRAIVSLYQEAFDGMDSFDTPCVKPNVEHAWHLYPLRLKLRRWTIDRGQFIEELAKRNIGASVHFIPLHEMTFYRDRYNLSDKDFPVAAEEAPRLVSIPLNANMSRSDALDVIDAVQDIQKHFGQ